MPDLERLQNTLDEIAETVEWAAGWLTYLETEELRGIGASDRAVLAANAARLRTVADALLPGRVRDAAADRRWYLAPDEAPARERELERALDAADAALAAARRGVTAKRAAEERARFEREHRDEERRQLNAERRLRITDHLRANGPATISELASATGLPTAEVELVARSVAKRRRDGRYVIGD